MPVHPTGEHACGSSDCNTRAALLALEPEQVVAVPPSVQFSTTVPVSALNTPDLDFGESPSAVAAARGGMDSVFSQARFSVAPLYTLLLLDVRCLGKRVGCRIHSKLGLVKCTTSLCTYLFQFSSTVPSIGAHKISAAWV